MVINPARDTSKMSAAELRQMAEQLMKQAEEQATKEFESTLNFLSDKLTMMGKTKKDAVIHLIKMMNSHEVEETMAELAEEYSDGIAHVTTRQDFQLHFVHIENAPSLMRLACAAGALATTVPGALPSLPDRDAVEALVSKRKGSRIA